MHVKIRHKNDEEPVYLCTVPGPENVEGVVKAIARAGGVIMRRNGQVIATHDPSSQLRYDFIFTEKSIYAEIVVHDEPQA